MGTGVNNCKCEYKLSWVPIRTWKVSTKCDPYLEAKISDSLSELQTTSMLEGFDQPTQSHLKNSNWESVIESLPQPKAGRETPTVPNGTGANVILCSEDGFKVALHEVLVRNCTKIFRFCSNISNFDQLRDKNDFLCFVLQGASEEMLRGLSDFLYTGSCQGLSHNEKKNILGLLDNEKCVETSVQLFNQVPA